MSSPSSSTLATARAALPIGKLLLPISDGLDFHQTHESTAEAACIAVAYEFRDLGQTLAWIQEQAASDVQANLHEHFAVAGAHAAKMTLQRARADLEGAGGSIKSCVTVTQQRDNDCADRLGRRQSDSSHWLVCGEKPVLLQEKRRFIIKQLRGSIWPSAAKTFAKRNSSDTLPAWLRDKDTQEALRPAKLRPRQNFFGR